MLAENYDGPRAPLLPVGGRTGLRFGGGMPAGSVLVQTGDLRRVIDYPDRDMTITVEAGLRMEELHERLAAQQQRLPVDVPQSHRATLGGAIACNASGPGRYGYGTFRDYVIGISAVDGRGRLFSAGGRVVKNVAGYDLCKLLTGSLGTLAVITQVTLKLRPQVESRRFVLASARQTSDLEAMLAALNTSATRPVAIEVLNPKAAWQLRSEARQDLPTEMFLLCIGFEGSTLETDWQIKTVLQELQPHCVGTPLVLTQENADLLWRALTEYQAASDDPLTFQITVLPSRVTAVLEQATALGMAVQAHAGNGILIGHLPDRYADAGNALQLLGTLRKTIQQAGGSLTVLNCEHDWAAPAGEFGISLREDALQRRLKLAFDPANILSPGRLWPAAVTMK
ncbi:glycolate oxidase FAD binding subunit [Planctomicrobium piriforme]|uniref:Glycolate oxidase FAD binding subunit n=2 Tax=Planctomicrobium piriforme TaxID=1576369 RepID=A0A1I3IBH7_9PLAN|nr:glycolate oxidase FAD binding subunit [Planctomicrobium piriforme]